MATASRSASTSSLRALLLALAIVAAAGRAEAWPSLESVHGHMLMGYAQLLNSGAPSGSMGFGGGVDVPLRPSLRAGIDLNYDLLGSQVADSSSVSADLDYSMVELLALIHWTPPRGPWRISIGTSLAHARTAISTPAPSYFEHLSVNETAPGGALAIELLSRKESRVRAGLEAGVHAVWMAQGTWTVAKVRLAIHY